MLCCFEYYPCDLYAVNNYWNTSCLHLRRQMSYAPKIRSITLFILVKSMCLVRACLLGACMVYLLVQSSMFGINIPGCEGSCIHIQTYCWKKKKTWIIITIVNIHSIALYQCACAQMEWKQLQSIVYTHGIPPFQTLIFRGLNPTNMSSVAMLEYLQNWLSVSREVDASSYSLLLHLPIFLAYNQPSNFHLIYSWCTRKGLFECIHLGLKKF